MSNVNIEPPHNPNQVAREAEILSLEAQFALPSQPQELEEGHELATSTPDSFPFREERLEKGEPYTAGQGASLFDPKDVKDFIGFEASVPMMIKAADKDLMLLDIRAYDADEQGVRTLTPLDGQPLSLRADFLLVSPDELDLSRDGDRGYKGVRIGEEVVFGRSEEKIKKRFDLSSDQVSRKHFSLIAGEGAIEISDLGSANGTDIITPDHTTTSGRTSKAVDRMKGNIDFIAPSEEAPYGYYGRHHILGRGSSRIDGGVYLGGSSREAIVVDEEQDPRLESSYRKLQARDVKHGIARRALRGNVEQGEAAQLDGVMRFVQEAMVYDGDAVDQISRANAGDKKVLLGDFIEQGVGVCRQQGLLAAYFIEKMITEGKLEGSVSIQRNTVTDINGGGGGHAWALFTDKNGQEFVIDPAQSFVGTKKEARNGNRWDYYLPMAS